MRRGGALLLFLVGCRAERLGVHLPPTGINAVNVEDLQRDTFGLGGPQLPSRAAGTAGATASAAWMAERFGQMSLLPGFGAEWARPLPDGRVVVCGRRDGAGEGAMLTVALDENTHERGTVAMAATIALAKSVTGREAPPRTLFFCSVPEPDGLDALLAAPPVPKADIALLTLVGPFGDGALQVRDLDPIQGVPARRFATEGAGETPEPPLEDLDFRGVLDTVRDAHGWLLRLPTDGPPPSSARPRAKGGAGRPMPGQP